MREALGMLLGARRRLRGVDRIAFDDCLTADMRGERK